MAELDPLRTVLVPALGGLALGLVTLGIARMRPRRAVDPIEANALYRRAHVAERQPDRRAADHHVERRRRLDRAGGRLHPDRLRHRLAARAHASGCGATTCACWWAAAPPAAIAGAFNAPLTGAFYAFELVIGTYTLATFAPVAVAAHRVA